jgi:hypothetical protein
VAVPAPANLRREPGRLERRSGGLTETLALLEGARTWGEWPFAKGDRRHWKAIQNVTWDIETLRDYLTKIVRADIRRRRGAGPASVLKEKVMA